MNLQLLETFVKVAELKNFTRAGEQLKYSQPTITLHIKQLEQELDVCLIERNMKGIRLTSQGEKFLPLAKQVLREWKSVVDRMNDTEEQRVKIDIACPEVLAIAILGPVIEKMYQKFPLFSLDVVRSIYPENVEMLARNEVDFIYVINRLMEMDGLQKLLEVKSSIVFVCSAEHPILEKVFSIKDLERYPFIVPLSGSVTSYVYDVMECFQDRDVHINSIIRPGSVELMRKLVLSNVGISCLPYCFVKNDVEQGRMRILEFEGVDIRMYQQVFCMQGRTLSKADYAMIEFIKDELEKIGDISKQKG